MKETGYKAATHFVDASTFAHYAPGDPIDPRTLKLSKDADDRTEELERKGLIVKNNVKLAPNSIDGDGTLVDRFEMREGESVEDARKRAGLAPVNLVAETSKAAEQAAVGAGDANTPVARDKPAIEAAKKSD